MKEFDLIARYLKPLAGEGAPAFRLGDDAAVLAPPPGQDIVLTKDVMVEGVHFPHGEDAALVARKLLRVNLSDLAAMGADAIGYLVGLIGSGELTAHWMEGFAAGLQEDQNEFGIKLLGGDTVAGSRSLALSLTAIGSVPSGQHLRRGGARPGDGLFVSGSVGDGALGLKCVSGELEPDVYLLDRYMLPRPRLGLGRALRGLATACIDISDGLIADAGHIADESGCQVIIEQHNLPLSPAAAAHVATDPALWPTIWAGGDDYELLFTAPLDRAGRLRKIADGTEVPVTQIGRIEAGEGIVLLDQAGDVVEIGSAGFEHDLGTE